MPALIVRSTDGSVRHVTLSSEPVTVGRAEWCAVRLTGDEISREHAEIWLDENGRVLVADKRSKNGTRVDGGEAFRNSQRAARRSIHIGEHQIDIMGVDDAEAETTAGIRFQADSATHAGQRSFFPSSRRIDLDHQRLNLLMSLTDRIGGAFERKQLLEQALDACCDALGFERGLIVLKKLRGETELPVARNVQKDETGAYRVSRTLINRALVHGERAVVNDPAVDLAGNITESLVRFPICSALCVPILHRDDILGVIYGDRITQGSTYTTEDVDFLAAIARQVGVGIANLRMFEKHLEMQRVMEELRQARTIQQSMLPGKPMQAGRVVLAGYNEPSSAVGGDYYDYFPLPDGRIGFIIADVTGHGLPAALVMANLHAAVHVALTDRAALADLATRLNQLVCDSSDTNVFITACLGRLDPKTGVAEFVNAGHPAPLVMYRGDISPLDDGYALPWGIDVNEKFHLQHLGPSDGIEAALFYTDGLIEAANATGQMLDLGPVTQALAGLGSRVPDVLVREALGVVRRHLDGHKNADDLTLLALGYGGEVQ